MFISSTYLYLVEGHIVSCSGGLQFLSCCSGAGYQLHCLDRRLAVCWPNQRGRLCLDWASVAGCLSTSLAKDRTAGYMCGHHSSLLAGHLCTDHRRCLPCIAFCGLRPGVAALLSHRGGCVAFDIALSLQHQDPGSLLAPSYWYFGLLFLVPCGCLFDGLLSAGICRARRRANIWWLWRAAGDARPSPACYGSLLCMGWSLRGNGHVAAADIDAGLQHRVHMLSPAFL